MGVRPQENGNKFETKWMQLYAKDGGCGGLLISARDPSPKLEMQCHRYKLDDFDGGEVKTKQRCLHAGQLVPCSETSFCVDAMQMGVGGIDSWGRRPLTQHMIGASQEFDWSFSLRPLTGQQAQERAMATFDPP